MSDIGAPFPDDRKPMTLIMNESDNHRVLEREISKLRKKSRKWKEKFEYVFRENEILSMEASKLDGAHKQVNYLKQELKFKEQENEALRGLVSALEAANKKAKAEKLRSHAKVDTNSTQNSDDRVEPLSRQCETLSKENRELLKDIEHHAHECNRKSKEIQRQKQRIEELELSLDAAQSDRSKMQLQKESRIADLEKLICDMEQKIEGTLPGSPSKNRNRKFSDDELLEEWEPVPLESRPEYSRDDPIIDDLLEMIPFDQRDGTSQLINDVLFLREDEVCPETQSVILNVPPKLEDGLVFTICPLMKKSTKTTLFKRSRMAKVIDVKVVVEPRGSIYSDRQENFGFDHCFLGPLKEDNSRVILHDLRYLHATKALYISEPDEEELLSIQDARSPISKGSEGGRNRFAIKKRFGNIVAGAKKQFAANFGAKYVHEHTICDSCRRTPIVGSRWSCATCEGYDLCGACYGSGIHGLENSDEMFTRVEDLVLDRCARLESEIDIIELLRYDICKSDLRKFSFCLNWLADVVSGKFTKDLKARALEIPNVDPSVRAQFVPQLMLVVSERKDIEVKTEWEPEEDHSGKNVKEVLRVWVADKYKTNSPFIKRNIEKYKSNENEYSSEDEYVH